MCDAWPAGVNVGLVIDLLNPTRRCHGRAAPWQLRSVVQSECLVSQGQPTGRVETDDPRPEREGVLSEKWETKWLVQGDLGRVYSLYQREKDKSRRQVGPQLYFCPPVTEATLSKRNWWRFQRDLLMKGNRLDQLRGFGHLVFAGL